jgi:hypothetical protein
MPARVYAAPGEIGDPPEIDFRDSSIPWGDVLRPEQEWVEKVVAWCKEFGKGDLRGEKLDWHRGDGYAQYVVYTEKPLALIWLPVGDAWSMDEIFLRGLRLSDVREQVRRQKALSEIFGKSKRGATK